MAKRQLEVTVKPVSETQVEVKAATVSGKARRTLFTQMVDGPPTGHALTVTFDLDVDVSTPGDVPAVNIVAPPKPEKK